ncbi:hypothetical protein JK163_02965 [Levilactobacillus brevis]|uniref:hypothetical protein n=1 Tax=Levilactobacillus brevis TaxID=1580 RepID=UPI001BA90386|nr:hypothetical protein [Levilactobacillus brevis]MBS1005272.1 hypothetical protein [Levilactobacillus brevis]MBS1012835.1 hypothetical protein [Levilactobacillus brevis]
MKWHRIVRHLAVILTGMVWGSQSLSAQAAEPYELEIMYKVEARDESGVKASRVFATVKQQVIPGEPFPGHLQLSQLKPLYIPLAADRPGSSARIIRYVAMEYNVAKVHLRFVDEQKTVVSQRESKAPLQIGGLVYITAPTGYQLAASQVAERFALQPEDTWTIGVQKVTGDETPSGEDKPTPPDPAPEPVTPDIPKPQPTPEPPTPDIPKPQPNPLPMPQPILDQTTVGSTGDKPAKQPTPVRPSASVGHQAPRDWWQSIPTAQAVKQVLHSPSMTKSKEFRDNHRRVRNTQTSRLQTARASVPSSDTATAKATTPQTNERASAASWWGFAGIWGCLGYVVYRRIRFYS